MANWSSTGFTVTSVTTNSATVSIAFYNGNPTIGGNARISLWLVDNGTYTKLSTSQVVGTGNSGTITRTASGLSPGTSYGIYALATLSSYDSTDFYSTYLNNYSSYGSSSAFTTLIPAPSINTSSGTMTYRGNSSFSISVSDANYNNGSPSFSPSLASLGLDFNYSNASGGSYSGLTIFGVPNFTSKSLSVTIYGPGGSASRTISISAPTGASTSILSNTLPTSLNQGQSYSANSWNVLASGSWTISWNYTGLPAGITSNSNSGSTSSPSYIYFSGTPTAYGAYSATIYANNPYTSYNSVSTSKNITVTPATPVFSDQSIGLSMRVGTSYGSGNSEQVLASYTESYSLISGTTSPPPGISIDNNGYVYGTPTVAGSYNFKIRATNGNATYGIKTKDTNAFSITVLPPLPVWVPETIALPSPRVNQLYTPSVSATNATSYSYTGSLPPGISFNSSGQFSGSPTAEGDYSFTLFASNSAGESISQAYTLTVLPPGGLARIYNSSTGLWEMDKRVYIYNGSSWVTSYIYIYDSISQTWILAQ